MTNPWMAVAFAASLLGCSATPTGGESEAAVASALTPKSKAAGASLTDEMPSPSGGFQTFSTLGAIDASGPFFQSLGSNGRACVHCHQPQDGWGITPPNLLARFNATTPKGTDPIFRPVDGATSPTADVSTEAARQVAYSMLLTKGLIRIGIGVPANAEYDLIAVDDPYGYASGRELSLFRRPLPTTNLSFLTTVMWDGRESFPSQAITFDLLDQSNSATVNHAQAAAPGLDPATQAAIVNFELTLYTAATTDNDAKNLTAKQASGGPAALAAAPFHLGINDVLGGDPATGAPPFSPSVFHLYDSWVGAPGGGTEAARAAVARGEALFNNGPIAITGVKGLNDTLGVTTLAGTCTTCHDTPAVGNHSVALALNIGLTDAVRRTPDMPLYTLRNRTTGETVQTTDPGRALITGRWTDVGKFKGAILRGLAARAPYFHNGLAASLDDVVNFYDGRFGIGFTPQQHSDLVAFLKTL